MSKIKHFELKLVLQRGWLLYRASIRSCFWLAFVYALASQLMSVCSQHWIVISDERIAIQNVFALFLTLLVGIMVMTLVAAVIMVRQNTTLFHSKLPQPGRYVLKKLPILLVASVIFNFAVSAGLLLYVIPGIVAMLLLYFYMPAILFENKGVFNAFYYSFQLVRQSFFNVLGIVLLNFLILRMPVFLIHVIFNYTVPDHTLSGAFGLEEVLIILVQAVVLPLTIALTLTAFYYLRELSHVRP